MSSLTQKILTTIAFFSIAANAYTATPAKIQPKISTTSKIVATQKPRGYFSKGGKVSTKEENLVGKLQSFHSIKADGKYGSRSSKAFKASGLDLNKDGKLTIDEINNYTSSRGFKNIFVKPEVKNEIKIKVQKPYMVITENKASMKQAKKAPISIKTFKENLKPQEEPIDVRLAKEVLENSKVNIRTTPEFSNKKLERVLAEKGRYGKLYRAGAKNIQQILVDNGFKLKPTKRAENGVDGYFGSDSANVAIKAGLDANKNNIITFGEYLAFKNLKAPKIVEPNYKDIDEKIKKIKSSKKAVSLENIFAGKLKSKTIQPKVNIYSTKRNITTRKTPEQKGEAILETVSNRMNDNYIQGKKANEGYHLGYAKGIKVDGVKCDAQSLKAKYAFNKFGYDKAIRKDKAENKFQIRGPSKDISYDLGRWIESVNKLGSNKFIDNAQKLERYSKYANPRLMTKFNEYIQNKAVLEDFFRKALSGLEPTSLNENIAKKYITIDSYAEMQEAGNYLKKQTNYFHKKDVQDDVKFGAILMSQIININSMSGAYHPAGSGSSGVTGGTSGSLGPGL